MNIKDQPAPKGGTGPAVWDLVIRDVETSTMTESDCEKQTAAVLIADMRERDRIGVERYGVRLQAHNGRNALVDAYQELLDALAYLRQALEENANDPTEVAYARTLGTTAVVRELLSADDYRHTIAKSDMASKCTGAGVMHGATAFGQDGRPLGGKADAWPPCPLCVRANLAFVQEHDESCGQRPDWVHEFLQGVPGTTGVHLTNVPEDRS
jgi:hypothetical protein